MKNRFLVQSVLGLLLNCLALISLNAQQPERVKPIARPISLSGNFGELRATHFHSGIDLRTGGVEGVPVACVRDGRVVRVRVSPVGYGQALYVAHSDGTTTVYGHLQRFCPAVSDVVRRIQYDRQSFAIDEDVSGEGLFFKQGEIMAYSGNSGSSGGPHLHFEVRNTQTERALNPLLFYEIDDKIPPVVKALCLYSVSGQGYVELIGRKQPVLQSAGHYACGQVAVPAGKIGLAFHALDRMDGSLNKLGLYRLQVVCGGDTLFRMEMDSCAFEQAYLINEVKDFNSYKKRETVYRCFGFYQEQMIGVGNKNKGMVEIAPGQSIPVKVYLDDMNGNRSRLFFTLIGGAVREPDEKELLRYDSAYCLELPGGRLDLLPGCLPYSVLKHPEVEKDDVTGLPVFVLSREEVPLLKKARLHLSGDFSPFTLICEVDGQGRKYPLETSRTVDGLTADIGYLSRYTAIEDRTAPSIIYLGTSPSHEVKFKISDDLSGISEYRGEVNGEWCLFTYDAKNSLFRCSSLEPAFRRDQLNEVRVIVKDKVGNKNEVIVKLKNE